MLIWPTVEGAIYLGVNYPRSFSISGFSRKLVSPIMQIIPQLISAYGIFRLQRSSGSKSTLLFLWQRSMDMMLVQITRLGVPTSCKRGYVTGSNLFSEANLKLSQLLGQRLDDIWRHDLTPDQRVIIMKQVSSYEGELFKTRFPSIGSIYEDPQTGFRVGRLGPSVSFDHNFSKDRGPWKSVRAYLRSYVTAEQSWLAGFKLAECTEDYETLRRRICPDEDPNAHISYFKSMCDIVGRIIDYAQFIDKIDPTIDHFVLFHEEIRTNNILVAYDDPTRVVGIVDWEGARVLPMWSCFGESQVAETDTTPEQYLPLRELRRQIMFDMEPGLSQVDKGVGLALDWLHDLVSHPLSARHSVSILNDILRDNLFPQRPLGEDAFMELAKFIAAQRS